MSICWMHGMELQLGLALPISNPIPLKGFEFDLNGFGSDPMPVMGHDPWSHGVDGGRRPCLSSESIGDCNVKKRCFDVAEETQALVQPPTLPLLLWSNQPNENDDDHHKELDKNSSTITLSDGEDEGVVGWPPIKSWRRKLCHAGNERWIYESGGRGGNRRDGGGSGSGSKSTYVKVKMEGVAIARKIDLSLHHSYETLVDTLVGMFGRGDQENVKAYELTYQDVEGDWLLAGDVPWSSFIQSVQRLKLVRSSD